MRTYLCAILVALAVPAIAHAQSADLVLCDRVAADPSDPDKPADAASGGADKTSPAKPADSKMAPPKK